MVLKDEHDVVNLNLDDIAYDIMVGVLAADDKDCYDRHHFES
jgi:hypothetical protein